MTLDEYVQQWQQDALAALKTPPPLTPGQAIGAAGAKAADLGLLQKPAVKP